MHRCIFRPRHHQPNNRDRNPFPKSLSIPCLIITTLFMIVSLVSHSTSEASTTQPNILVINSYHLGYIWGDNILKGLSEAFAGNPEINCHFEYLDTARHPNEDHLELMRDLLKVKYSHTGFDCIVTCDDAALRFVLTKCYDLFRDVPLVFCGVNDPPKPGDTHGRTITGVIEQTDIRGTIALALKLHPSTSSITIIHDNTAGGNLAAKKVRDSMPEFRDRLKINTVTGAAVTDIVPQLEKLSDDTIGLLLQFTMSDDDVLYTPRQIIKMICDASPVPVYSLWDFTLGNGVIGGNVVSGFMQGQTAGDMVMRILDGDPADSIPIVSTSPNSIMFDYSVMKRFHIRTYMIPEGSILINEPLDYFVRYKNLIRLIMAFLILLSLLSISLLVNRTSRLNAERSLNRERTMLKSLMDTIPDLIYIKNREGIYILVNKALAEWLGLDDPDDVIGKKDSDFYSSDYSAKARENELKLIRGEEAVIESEDSEIWPDGRATWVSAIKVPMMDDSGNITGVIGISRNITERKNAEIALRESEEKFRMINDVTREGLTIQDNSTIVYANHVYAQMFGYGLKEIIGMDVSELIAPDCRETVKRLMKEVWDEPYETTGLRQDGTEFIVEVVAKPVFLSGKQYRMAALRDITEQKLYKQRIESSEHRYRTIFEKVPVSIWEYDFSATAELFNHLRDMHLDDYLSYLLEHPDIVDAIISTFKIVDINERTVAMYGARSKEELIETYGRDELPETRMNTLKAVAAHLSGAREYVGETLNKTIDGHIINVITYVNFPEDDTMGTHGLVAAVDITDKKMLEEKLSASIDEKVLLLREVHHRVKNNLQVVSSMFDLYSMESRDPNVIEVLNNARSKIHTMALIHSQLYQRESFDKIDMEEYSHSLLNYLGQVYTIDGREITRNVTGSLYLPVTTAIPLAIILNELIINAYKHAFPDKQKGMIEILLSEKKPGEYASITVRDDGIGLESEFDIDSSSSLGMKLINNLVKRQLNGTITITSNNGCTVVITIDSTTE